MFDSQSLGDFHPELARRIQERIDAGFDSSDVDYEEACDTLRALVESGASPLVTIDRRYLEVVLREGLVARSTHIPGLNLIAGVIGRRAFLPEGEDRVVLRVNRLTAAHIPGQIAPRLTGKPPAFNGVIYFPKGFVPPTMLEVVS